MSRWDNASLVEQQVWDWRLADLPRDENRTIINRLYNGDAPFDEAEAEANQIQINRNNLQGPNMLGNARRQWNAAMLKPGNFFSVTSHKGPKIKRREISHSITKNANFVLRKSQPYKEQRRQTGAAVMLHGIGPTTWANRTSPVPAVIPIASVLVPSETYLDMENLDRFAIFRELTPSQLWSLTHGPSVDPGWNMKVVESQYEYVRSMVQKQPNATAYQYMPSRIEELSKQDLGFWGSDAVPTVDCWDFYFRDDEAGGWKRRMILDWGITDGNYGEHSGKAAPKTKSGGDNGNFIYTSKDRKFADSLEEIIHFNFGDLSVVTPFTYHAIRSLGWMLWGVCDMENRLECKFNEAVFEQLLWFFRVTGNADLTRIKKANFMHMGVIPSGVAMVKSDERYKPDAALVDMLFRRNADRMQSFSSSYTQDNSHAQSGREQTATEVMARVNTVNQLVSGMMQLAYDYEESKDYEILRRLCNPDSKAKESKLFRRLCLEEGVPPEVLADPECLEISEDRVLGGGNKTLEMAQVQFLRGMRKDLPPDSQREVDHISIESSTDDAALAERLAPLDGKAEVSSSMHDAQLTTERLMRGLPFVPTRDMVAEDYVKVWIADLTQMVQGAVQSGGMANPSDILGWQNMDKTINALLQLMSQDPEEMEKVRRYQEQLSQQMNEVKAFVQRLQQQQKAAAKQNGNGNGNGADYAKAMLELQTDKAKADMKLKNMQASHAQRTAQKQVQFELDQQREERRTNADIRRKTADHALDLAASRMRSFQE
jgi:hypothetical protein